MIKSILILLGIGLVLPWLSEVFYEWHNRALALDIVLPFLSLWAGLALLVRSVATRRAHDFVLQDTQPAVQVSARLSLALDRVMEAYDHTPSQEVSKGLVSCNSECLERPELLVSNRRLQSPVALTSEVRPTIVFPTGLLAQLNDAELEAALAHEVAHFTLIRPSWCSPTTFGRFSVASPVAAIITSQLHREEEKACDEMAVAVLAQPDVFAEMLLKSYRYAVKNSGLRLGRLQGVPQLIGLKPMISERVENILHPRPFPDMGLQKAMTCLVWIGVSTLFLVFV